MSERKSPWNAGRAVLWLVLLAGLVWIALRGWALFEVRRAVSEFESRHGTLRVAQLTRPAPATPNNGATYFEAAAKLFSAKAEEREALSALFRNEPDAATPVSAADQVAELARRNDLPSRIFRAGSDVTGCVFAPAPPRSVEEPVAPMLPLLELARLELVLDRGAGVVGRPLETSRALPRVLALSRCLQRERLLIHQLIGGAIEGLALSETNRRLERGALGDAAGSILPALVREDELPGIVDTLKFDLLAFRPMTEEHPYRDLFREGPFWHPFSVRGYAWSSTVRVYDRIARGLEVRAPSAPASHAKFASELDQVMVEALYPNLRDWIDKRERQRTLRELAAIALRLDRLAIETGSRSAALERLRSETGGAGSLVASLSIHTEPDGATVLHLPDDRHPPDGPSRSAESIRRAWTWRLPPPPR